MCFSETNLHRFLGSVLGCKWIHLEGQGVGNSYELCGGAGSADTAQEIGSSMGVGAATGIRVF